MVRLTFERIMLFLFLAAVFYLGPLRRPTCSKSSTEGCTTIALPRPRTEQVGTPVGGHRAFAVQRPANTTPGSNSDAGSRLNHTDGSRRRASASAEHAVLMPSAADQDLRLAAADLQQPSAETMKELPAATWPFAALMQGASTPWVLSWVLAANFTSALVCCPTPPMFYMAQCRPLASTCQHKQLVMPSAADNTMPPMQEPRAGASPLAVVVLGASTPWVLSWALAAKSTSALVCCPTPPMFYMAQCASLVSTCQSRHPSGSAAGTVDTLATTLSPAPVEAHSSTGGIHTGSGCSSVTTLSWWMQGRSSLCLEETAAVDPAEGAAECPSLPWWFVVVPSMAAAPAAAAVLPHQHGMVCLPASLIAVKMQLPADDVCPTAAVEAVHWNSTCPVRMLTPHSYGRDLGLNQPAQDTAQGPSQHAFRTPLAFRVFMCMYALVVAAMLPIDKVLAVLDALKRAWAWSWCMVNRVTVNQLDRLILFSLAASASFHWADFQVTILCIGGLAACLWPPCPTALGRGI